MTHQIEALQGYANDMLAVERELHGAFTRQRDDITLLQHPAAAQLVARTIEILERHVGALQTCLKRLGSDESVLKKTVGAVLGAAAGFYDRIRTDNSVSRVLRDDYTALTFACVCNEMLHTAALAMKDELTAKMAIDHLKDFTPLIMDIGRILPQVVTDELAADGKAAADSSVVQTSIKNVRDAWSQSASVH